MFFCGVEGVDVVGDYSDDVSVHSQAAPITLLNIKKNASMPKKEKKGGLYISKEFISQ